jgi:hypothetical protein
MVTEADYTVWRANFGATSPPPGAASAISIVATSAGASWENADELKATQNASSTGESTSLVGVASNATTPRSTSSRPALRSALAVDNSSHDALVDWLASSLAERRREPPASGDDAWPSDFNARKRADDESFEALDVAFAAL